jgi:hypothetical protein
MSKTGLASFPPEPDVPAAQRAEGQVRLRYEDVTQDGRLALAALPHALGEVLWRSALADASMTQALRAAGVVPILTRVVVEGGGGPVSVRRPLDGSGCFQLAHAVDEHGAGSTRLLNMWVSVRGLSGRTHGPPPDGAGEPVTAGRVFAEHVFTRLFAPAGERRVLRLDAPGLPAVPPARVDWQPPEALLEPPAGAAWLEPAPAPDGAPVVFALDHTDSNQHVNSLVYPRLFTDAALRRLAALGRSTAALLARAGEVAWRKPCFAGEKMRIVLRAFAVGEAVGACGALGPDGAAHDQRDAGRASGTGGASGPGRAGGSGGAAARPYCCLRVLFSDAAPAW